MTVSIVDLLSGDAINPTDFSLSSTTVTFPIGSGNGATETIDLVPVDDDLVEGNETVDLQLQSPTSLNGQVTVGANSDQTITIDDEDAATVELTGTATVLESGTVDLTITLGTAAGVTLQDALTVDLNALASSTGLDPCRLQL